MGRIRPYLPVKLFAAVTIASTDLWEAIRIQLEEKFSHIDDMSEWYEFHHTGHYEVEMGRRLKKRMVSFEDLILAESLPDVKLATNAMEEEHALARQRQVNIDPGYLALPRVVLATTKDYSHRIYLRQGIFADLHLEFRNGTFRPKEWTYPDYREPFNIRFFNQLRERYIEELAVAGM